MKPPALRAVELAAPKLQSNWDWRAAANFICGGAGGGLLICGAFAGLGPEATRGAVMLALALIACGLTCVWFEIGRPLRALNVYRHIATSWMTREAVVALVVFACGALAVLTASAVLAAVAGVCGLAFLYSQARILGANKGIPAWRHPASVPLMVATGLAEGAGFVAMIAAIVSGKAPAPVLLLLLMLVVVRAWFWRRYLAGLEATGAPVAALRVLSELGPRLLLLGHALPVAAILVVMLGGFGTAAGAFLAGALTVASGWVLKFSLIRRAAFTQGLAIDRVPVRGRGPAGPAAKPGWKMMRGSKFG